MTDLKELEASIGGYDLSHLDERRLKKFKKKLQRLGDSSLSIEERWTIKLELAQEVLTNKENKR
ncbi:hypothetical protein [Cytobacillus luteolus]|uniref:hypothetical protein n=1 Tax=Litchfieldia luteola TaxID=682179 RepID=UPI001AE6153F|nr:hypothetical protein [Cytobacillus luteolus]MBP1944647.1 hypothetical protein [Cytobacillus luteolus]